MPARVLGAQLGELGRLVPLGRPRPAPQLLAEVAQQRQAELAVGVDVHPDQPHVRQPARVARARREPGERHALLEVEQVERQLVGGVAGAQARPARRRAGWSCRSRTGRRSARAAGRRRACTSTGRRRCRRRAARAAPRAEDSVHSLLRQQVGEAAPAAGPASTRSARPRQNAATRSAGGGGSSATGRSARQAARAVPPLHLDPLDRRRRSARAGRGRQVHAARDAGAGDPVELGPLGGGQLLGGRGVAEEHDDPPRLRPRRRAARRPARPATRTRRPSTLSLIRRMCSTRSSSRSVSPPGPTNVSRPAPPSGANAGQRCRRAARGRRR